MKILNIGIKSFLMLIAVFLMESSTLVYNESKVENENVSKNVNLSTMALKIEEIEVNKHYTALDTFTGDLTGYTFDCPLCGGTLGCLPSYNIKDGKDYYIDNTYKKVKIVASSKNLPCGSIVRFQSDRISKDPIIAIVLDRGVRGNSLDLLSPTQEYARTNVGRSSITYDVLRFGWE